MICGGMSHIGKATQRPKRVRAAPLIGDVRKVFRHTLRLTQQCMLTKICCKRFLHARRGLSIVAGKRASIKIFNIGRLRTPCSVTFRTHNALNRRKQALFELCIIGACVKQQHGGIGYDICLATSRNRANRKYNALV